MAAIRSAPVRFFAPAAAFGFIAGDASRACMSASSTLRNPPILMRSIMSASSSGLWISIVIAITHYISMLAHLALEDASLKRVYVHLFRPTLAAQRVPPAVHRSIVAQQELQMAK